MNADSTVKFYSGFEHAVPSVVHELLKCLQHPALAVMQWNEAFSVAQVALFSSHHGPALLHLHCWAAH